MLSGLLIAVLMRVVFVTVALSSPAPADAQMQQQMDWCRNKDYVYSPVLQIKGCTAVIQSGRLSGQDLALTFNNRGNAYSDRTITTAPSLTSTKPSGAIRYLPSHTTVVAKRTMARTI